MRKPADEFIQNFEKKTQTDVVVLDFSNAFDVVPHQRLLHKFDQYGIRGTTLNWIQNVLTNITQKGSLCRWLPPVSIKCRADQVQVQRDLSALQDWADRWGMFQHFEMIGPEGFQAKIKQTRNFSTPLKAKH